MTAPTTPPAQAEPAPGIKSCCQDFDKCREMCCARADYWQGQASQLRASLAPSPKPEAPSIPPGWQFLKDSTHAERSWPEDAGHENGNYSCCCVVCLRMFVGHKRRAICKVCVSAPATPPAPTEQAEPEAEVPEGYALVQIDHRDRLECCRRLLNMIANGESDDPRKDARDELNAHGFWDDPTDALEPAEPEKLRAEQADREDAARLREWAKRMAAEGDPPACVGCGAMAGVCGNYPNCPGGDDARASQAQQPGPTEPAKG